MVAFSEKGSGVIMEGFGLRLENLREKAGYSKKELSRLLDYTDNVYGHYERGERSPTLETIVKLAELLDTSPNELILGKKNDGKHYKLFEELIDIFTKKWNP